MFLLLRSLQPLDHCDGFFKLLFASDWLMKATMYTVRAQCYYTVTDQNTSTVHVIYLIT